MKRVVTRPLTFPRASAAVLGAALTLALPPALALASTGPVDAETISTSPRFASGVVGSLTLRALLMASSDGQPQFTCECTKMTQVVSTAQGVNAEARTFCD